ncbi:MAG: BamA/TamA family outer membrane protein, partial [Pyrinomonadaceae bacterium]|nr:BamA/TamA family outer membrane protein [Pyrinomonadaceae bacterium]
GTFNIRNINLMGRLYQGGARIRASRFQQLVQLDFINPRFIPDGERKFAPLTLSAQYSRDTGVTRFFRSTLDRGTFGVVQRLDEDGNPIDQFGESTGAPSINRLSFTAETSRTVSRKTRSFLFLRYRFEDVRILNTTSLLVAPILEPDRNVRLSSLGGTFSRDTRANCNNKRTILEQIRTGEVGDPCRYNPTDATKGEFLTIDYALSLRQLGGNVSFSKLQVTYQRYYQIKQLNKTVIAGRAIFGLASIFNAQDRNNNGTIDENDKTLPISERFFAGGSTDLRGFAFQQAGPRIAILPQGQFRDRNNDPITLFPFTIPFGGNALAVINAEARIPLTTIFQIVPFYDGGNVFRRVGEIFKPRVSTPNDIVNQNLRAVFTNTFGLGLRLKTPIGGSVNIDYGYILNPPAFIVPEQNLPNSTLRLRQGQFHFRFTQAF